MRNCEFTHAAVIILFIKFVRSFAPQPPRLQVIIPSPGAIISARAALVGWLRLASTEFMAGWLAGWPELEGNN